jgi:CRISPR system Cascade subunit CasE
MFISKLELYDPFSNDAVRNDIASVYKTHQRVYSAFSKYDQVGRVLYRVDKQKEGVVIVVQSEKNPNWANLPDGYFQKYEVKEIDLDAIQIKPGQRFIFSLRCCPSKDSKPEQGKKRRKVLSIYDEEERKRWIERKILESGGKLGEWASSGYSMIPVDKPGCDHKMMVIDVFGTITVDNPKVFKAALMLGIGRNKGFGCGFLAVRPIK